MKQMLLLAVFSLTTYSLRAQQVPVVFQSGLGQVVNASFNLTDQLIAGNAAEAARQAKNVLAVLDQVKAAGLQGADAQAWSSAQKELSAGLNKIAGSSELKIQREAFAGFSQQLYNLIKETAIQGVDAVYYQYCPMAMSGAGGYWLSASKEINNPYFGSQMLHCGMTKETLVGK